MAHEVRVYYSNTSCFKQKNLREWIPGSGPLEMRPLPLASFETPSPYRTAKASTGADFPFTDRFSSSLKGMLWRSSGLTRA